MSGLTGVSRMAPAKGRTRSSSSPVLEVAGLRMAIDAPPVDLSLRPGTTLTLFGNQATALSRLLDTMAGLLPPLGGTVTVKGENISGLPPARRHMRIVSARDPLFPHLNVQQNIAFSLRANGQNPAEARAAAGRMISLLGLDGVTEQRPAALSPEHVLRTKLGRALATAPDILLLDDPLGPLDPPAARRISTLLVTLSRALDLSMVHAVSRREHALNSGGQIAVFHNSTLLQCDDAARLYDRPACVEVATLFGETNALTGQVLDIGDDVARIHLACGGVVDAMASEELTAGQECLVCVQPDRISPFFGAQGLGMDDDGEIPVQGILSDSIHLGDHIRMRVRCAEGTEIELRRPPLQAQKIPKAGTAVQLAWPAAHATAFPLPPGMY